jgi:two-component system sensor histidine kinase KdpD
MPRLLPCRHMSTPSFSPFDLRRFASAAAVWVLAWVAMVMLDGKVALSGLAMLMVLASALATLWLPIVASLIVTAASVVAFNWSFVPPRHALTVDLRQDALLLAGMLAVSWVVAAVVARQRQLADRARWHALQAEQLRHLGDALRDADDPAEQAGLLREALTQLLGVAPALLVLRGALPAQDDPQTALVVGAPDAHALSGLWHCTRQRQAFGPGTGRHADLPEWYLPLRGRQAAFGAMHIAFQTLNPPDAHLRVQAQALCDQMGLALQRAQVRREATEAQHQAQLQGVRNAMLAAISHDYRTPLAAILSAASSLQEQGERLTPAQRQRLAQSIADETVQLSRLTDNTLQLARLDAPAVQLRLDWESAEEIVGSVLAHARRHDPTRRVRARLEPGLPLVRCDAILLTQLLDNLTDNALKYSPAEAPVELLVRHQGEQLVFAVRDRGPGVAPGWRERIFEVFQRGEFAPQAGQRLGAGVGLAVCRAIARAHGGELKLRPRGHGGTSFECWLPAPPPPQVAEAPP